MRRHLHVLLVVATLFVFHKAEEKVSYEGYKLMRLYPTTREHVELISQFEAKDPSFDVWSESKNSVDVVIAPKALGDYAMFFVAKKIRFEVINDNIQDLINEEEKSMAKSKMSTGRNSIVYRYARHSEINNFIDTTAEENSDIVRSYTIGTTSQNRQMKVFVFDTKKHSRSIWIDCGIHAREWVAPGTCVYLINKLLHDYRNFDPDTVALLDKYEVHVLPVVNPDGYEYTHTTNRLWRKNRTSNPGSACIGTDLNRNYGFNWDAPGASTSPCSETYGGASAESELETKALIGAITAKSGNWDAYITVHSYGQLWLVPFGYSVTDKPVNDAEIRAAAKVGADAIENYNGTQFTVGSSAEILYVSTGSSRDWANGVAGIKYSNTLELRPSSSSPDASYGFVWPESRLPEVVHETFAGIMAFLKHVSANPI